MSALRGVDTMGVTTGNCNHWQPLPFLTTVEKAHLGKTALYFTLPYNTLGSEVFENYIYIYHSQEFDYYHDLFNVWQERDSCVCSQRELPEHSLVSSCVFRDREKGWPAPLPTQLSNSIIPGCDNLYTNVCVYLSIFHLA